MSKKKFSYEYPRPAVTVDVVLIAIIRKQKSVLLIKRKSEPFKNTWALPGGFIDEAESPLQAARRELLEETELKVSKLQQVGCFGDPGRDPRGWTISIAYKANVYAQKLKPQAASDAAEVEWFPVKKLPRIAFDHQTIIKMSLKKINYKSS